MAKVFSVEMYVSVQVEHWAPHSLSSQYIRSKCFDFDLLLQPKFLYHT